ncbi:MAG: MOP flippase family protein [Bacteroidales bacterium]|nr:MOP flippase family protein [Bacteroidales bacterium]
MNYTSNNKIRSGGIWSFLQNGGNHIIGFLLGIILARILSPEDFGMVAMVMVFIGFAGFLQQFGFNEALIQSQNVNTNDYSTVFWFNTFAGSILFVLFFWGSPLIGQIYDKPEFNLLTKYLAVNFLFSALSSVQGTILTKQFEFKKLAIIDLGTNLIMYAIAIPLAVLGHGVMSLVWGGIIQNLSKAAALWISSDWKPVFVFSKSSFKKLFKFGIFVFLQAPLGYIERNVDTFMIGKLSGDASLGLYNKAYQIMLLPIKNISNSFRRVLYPALSEAQNDNERGRMLILRMFRVVAFISFPIMFGIAAVAEPFIIGIYGEKWAGTVPLLQVLALVGANQSIGTFVGTGYNAKGKPQIGLYLNLVKTPLLVFVFFAGYNWNGLIGMVYAYFLFSITLSTVTFSILFKLYEIKVNHFFAYLGPSFLCSGGMAIIVKSISFMPWIQALPDIIQLFVLSFLGFVLYLTTIMLFKLDAFFDFANQMPYIKRLTLLKWYFKRYGK